jgi:hypothetical protein
MQRGTWLDADSSMIYWGDFEEKLQCVEAAGSSTTQRNRLWAHRADTNTAWFIHLNDRMICGRLLDNLPVSY